MLLPILLAAYAISLNLHTARCDVHHQNALTEITHNADADGDFKILRTRTDDRFFVDKSLFIKEVVETGEKLLTISRPPRFGKSVNLDMLRRFFEIPEDEREAQTNRDLFLGEDVEVNGSNKSLSKLNIADHPEIVDQYLGTYPVISLSFKHLNVNNLYEATISVCKEIVNFYHRHKYLRECFERKKLNPCAELKRDRYYSHYEYRVCLGLLVEHACKCYHKPVIVLIDDYDYIMNEALLKHGAGSIEIQRLEDFFVSMLKDVYEKKNKSVKWFIITCVIPFTLLGSSYSIAEKKFSPYFGLTVGEVDRLLTKVPPSLSRPDDIKIYYKRYTINNLNIYDSESIIKCLKNNGAVCEHWQTDGNLRILDQIPINSDIVTKVCRLSHGPLPDDFMPHFMPYTIIEIPDSIYTYLLHIGYLGLEHYKGLYYYSVIPNGGLRTQLALKRKMNDWVTTKLQLEKTERLLEYLSQLKLHDFHELVEEILRNATLAGLYSGAQEHYAITLEGLITNGSASDYSYKEDSESNDKRLDVIFVHAPSKRRALGFIIAIQMAKQNHTDCLTKTAARALSEISKLNYEVELRRKNPHLRFLVKLGISYRDGQVGMKCQIETINVTSPDMYDVTLPHPGSPEKPHEIRMTSVPARSSTTKHTQTSSDANLSAPSTFNSTRFTIFIKSKLPALSDFSLRTMEKQLRFSEHNEAVFKRYLSSKGKKRGFNQTIRHLRAAIIHSNIRVAKEKSHPVVGFSKRYKCIVNSVVDVLRRWYKSDEYRSTLKQIVRRAFDELDLYGESSTIAANSGTDEETSALHSKSAWIDSDSDRFSDLSATDESAG